ncbi:Uncharacterised protein [Mycobacteroides abscessus subsp. massiliense]|nr:Uncharacterised protein [Mycobacteroides abscessus subsp. massiliense]
MQRRQNGVDPAEHVLRGGEVPPHVVGQRVDFVDEFGGVVHVPYQFVATGFRLQRVRRLEQALQTGGDLVELVTQIG